MKEQLKGIIFFSIIFVILDQAIKIFINSKMILNQSIILIKDLFSITLTHNTGAAFGILNDSRHLLIVIAVVVVIGLIIYVKNLEVIDDLDVFTYSLLFGGIIGNLIDRIVYGHVIDYLSFNFGSYYFPIFNCADMFIVIAIVFMIIRTIKGDLWKS